MFGPHAHLDPGEYRYCEHDEHGSKFKWLH